MDFNRIEELKSVRKQKSALSERELQLSIPLLTDLNLIETLYGWFKEIISTRDCPPRAESSAQRRKFIFIILFLYSPSALAGGRMASGLRSSLVEVLKLKSACIISINVANTVFFFRQYEEFRRDVENIYTELWNRLKNKGLVN